MPRHAPALAAAAVFAAATLSACGGSNSPPSNAADLTFLQDMLPHHMQAVAAGQLAATSGTDPRVIAFGKRIVSEQTPEIKRMQAMVSTLGLKLNADSGDAMAINRITPTELQTLGAAPVKQRDNDLMARSAVSEMGAVSMARAELAGGTYKPALTLAASIESAGNPGSEIAQLQSLAAKLPT